ncbi:MAG: NFACT RNA binding domain-containing protein [Aerococcus sp.]|nr:NFACT RNA binding domain-containing protein [Aerococcus sp.]
MSFDGLFTHAMVGELSAQFTQATIRKVQQPNNNSLVLTIRSQRKNHKLLITIDPSAARVQVTDADYVNPEVAPNFLMVMRKYIQGATIEAIEQWKTDRIIQFTLSQTNEIGDAKKLQLILELMGRHSNLFLINHEGEIIDTLKHVPIYQNSVRTILPGGQYTLPPQQDKRDPYAETIDQHMLSNLPTSSEIPPLAKAIQADWLGFGKDSARELAWRFNQVERNEWAETMQQFLKSFDHPTPTLTSQDQRWHFQATDFISVSGPKTTFETLSALLDNYYQKVTTHNHLSQLYDQLAQVVSHQLKHQKQKLQNLASDWEKSENADDYRIKGELLQAYLFKVEKGMTSITLPNFYNNETPLTISLDPALSPSENAQHYFKRYQKLQKSRRYIQAERAKANDDIQYFETIETQMALAEAKELEDIRQELIDEGIIKTQQKQKHKRQKTAEPRTFTSSEGHTIYVGRNNRQNDTLTLKQANKNHYWFHTQNIPGSHVILATDQPTAEEITEAAMKAAEFSKYRLSSNVPVDYTLVKDVKKPSGAKPGLVNYFNQKTVYVTPESPDAPKLEE